jgi:acyl-coenzyme A thioesterase PaaI-like protein
MSLRRLQEPPGSRCFVCAPGNPQGLAIPFQYDDVDGHVEAAVTFGDLQCGAPTYVHVGLAMTVMAEAMAWSVVSTTGRIAITLNSSTDFRRPLRIGVPYVVRASVDDVEEGAVRTSAVFGSGEDVHAAGAASFRVISENVAARLRARVSRPAPLPQSQPSTIGEA